MSPDALNTIVMDLMASVSTMTLATCRQNTPRATDLYFANDKLDLVFFSSADAEHSRNLAAHHHCSATIHPSVSGWKEIKGIRVDGIAHPVDDASLKGRARDAYLKKFPFAAQFLSPPIPSKQSASGNATGAVALYVLRVSGLTYIDNSLGFGTKYFAPVSDGEFTGTPTRNLKS
jgi:hypothetical protein